MRSVFIAMLAALTVLGGPVARAEDEVPVEKTAAQRFTERVASLPAPGEKFAFDVSGRVLAAKMDLGTWRMSSEAATLNGKAVWKCRDQVGVAFGESTVEYETVAYHDAKLRCRSGTGKKTESGNALESEWKQGETESLLTKESGDGVKTTTLDGKGGLCSVAALILFCRSALPAARDYECVIFDADPDEGEKHFKKGTISVKGPGKWREQDVLLVAMTRGKKTLSLAFAKQSHDFLGLDMADGSGVQMSLVVGAKPKSKLEWKDDFTPPADTPKEAAFIAALAFGARDSDLLDRIVHWKTLHDDLLLSNPTSKLTLDQLKASVFKKLTRNVKKPDRRKIIIAIRLVAGDVTVTMDGTDRATVKFPNAFKGLELEVGKVDGHWYLIRFPGT